MIAQRKSRLLELFNTIPEPVRHLLQHSAAQRGIMFGLGMSYNPVTEEPTWLLSSFRRGGSGWSFSYGQPQGHWEPIRPAEKGQGAIVLESICAMADEANAAIWLWCYRGMLPFYARFGFEVLEERSEYMLYLIRHPNPQRS